MRDMTELPEPPLPPPPPEPERFKRGIPLSSIVVGVACTSIPMAAMVIWLWTLS